MPPCWPGFFVMTAEVPAVPPNDRLRLGGFMVLPRMVIACSSSKPEILRQLKPDPARDDLRELMAASGTLFHSLVATIAEAAIPYPQLQRPRRWRSPVHPP